MPSQVMAFQAETNRAHRERALCDLEMWIENMRLCGAEENWLEFWQQQVDAIRSTSDVAYLKAGSPWHDAED